MNFRKTGLCLLIVLLCTGTVFPACAADGRAAENNYGYELFDVFLRNLHPESACLELREPPREDGFISWAYLECQNAKIRGMNIQSLKMDCFDAQVTPPAQWKDMDYPQVDSMLSCHAEGIFTEKDVNDYLRTQVFGTHHEWEDIQVKMGDGHIEATAYYNANLKLFRTRVRLDVSCSIAGRGTGLWLENIHIKINNQDISTGFIEKALQKLQPFIDMKNYNLPLYLTKIEFSKGMCRVRSRIRPNPLPSGLRWNYPGSQKGGHFLSAPAQQRQENED
jgi:hypothetical protein